ncbi:putative baseplate assembly protein, partial [filamentous cyanobacterium LEGE 11480]
DSGTSISLFQGQPQHNDCFYILFDRDTALDGNIIDLIIEGSAAEPTGINPKCPPWQWEAWNGGDWEKVFVSQDDTQGFSFANIIQRGPTGQPQAKISLRLPLKFPPHTFVGHQGRWLRCRCHLATHPQRSFSLSHSPTILSLTVQTIGGQIHAEQCERIEQEILGESTGKPGQRFQLENQNIMLPLQPDRGERLEVTPPNSPVQEWQLVKDFSNSDANDRHYTLDSIKGIIQLGPLIREPQHIQQQTVQRQQQSESLVTAHTNSNSQVVQYNHIPHKRPTYNPNESPIRSEYQRGQVPPIGSMLHIVAYRTGGGTNGNLPPDTIRIPKTAPPYIRHVTNHVAAIDGKNAETLEEAILRVPHLLRTQDRAVTPEDFEHLTQQASSEVSRAYCPRQQSSPRPGIVTVYVIPKEDAKHFEHDILPQSPSLAPELRQIISAYLDDRRLLGTDIHLLKPKYIGISTQIRIGIEAIHRHNPDPLCDQLAAKIMEYLHPLQGHHNGKGWQPGMKLYQSDLISLIQKFPGVRYLQSLQLFTHHQTQAGEQAEQSSEPQSIEPQWIRQFNPNEVIDPGLDSIIFGWNAPIAPRQSTYPAVKNDDRYPGHLIQVLELEGQR